MFVADLALARRLEAADARGGVEFAQAYVRLYPEKGAATEPVAGGYAVFTGAGSPLSQAKGMGLNGPVSEADIDRLEDFYRSRGAPVQVVLCPLADPTLLEPLGRRGYRLTEFENTLVRALEPDESFAPLPAGPRVDPAGPEEYVVFARTMVQGFFDGAEVPPDILEMISLPPPPGATGYLARVDGEPAGGGSLILHDRLAMVMGASTLTRFRNRGVQTALIQARLARAVAAGCDLAMTCTRPGTTSQRNVERQGFRVVYTRSVLVREWSK